MTVTSTKWSQSTSGFSYKITGGISEEDILFTSICLNSKTSFIALTNSSCLLSMMSAALRKIFLFTLEGVAAIVSLFTGSRLMSVHSFDACTISISNPLSDIIG